MSILEDFKHLKIQLQDIKSATNDFAVKPIGGGGFGKVYKGQLSFPEGSSMVAFKRLDRKFGQGDNEFWKEIMMLSELRHENLISLLGFCHEDTERILVYEYASRGSLDRCLSDTSLTWMQRLKICLGAANGLNYLHDPMNTQERVLHRDVKSSNILLDEKWTAKVSDFGLSKYGRANQPHTYLISNVVGTPGYCDPLYWETGFLSKESDVYSFGVVLFEVMCGRLCFENCNGELRILVPVWKKCYDENRLDDIICQDLKEQADADSLITFSGVANRCLNRDRKDRPTMAEIVEKLEIALDEQEISEDVEERMKFEEMRKIADHAATAVSYRSRKELKLLFSYGVLLSDQKTWFSQNRDGKNCEMVSAAKCMFTYPSLQLWPYQDRMAGLRFPISPSFSLDSKFQLNVSTRSLSPHATYTINLVYINRFPNQSLSLHIPFKYKLDVETMYSTSCVAQRKGVLVVTELYQFTSNQNQYDFRIQFMNHSNPPTYYQFLLEGIKFQPVECEKDKHLENENIQHPILDFDADALYFSDIMRWRRCPEVWNKEDLYCILRNGVLIEKNGEKWFSLTKNMKKRYIQPARGVLHESSLKSLIGRKWVYKPLRGSRFDMVAECPSIHSFTVVCDVESHLLSDGTAYACYLVYKLPQENKAFEDSVQLDHKSRFMGQDTRGQLIFLQTPPHTPIIDLNIDQESHVPLQTRKIKGHPKLRKDGWMEIQIWDFQIDSPNQTISMHCCLSSCSKKKFTGLLVQGIEFRPAKVLFSYIDLVPLIRA